LNKKQLQCLTAGCAVLVSTHHPQTCNAFPSSNGGGEALAPSGGEGLKVKVRQLPGIHASLLPQCWNNGQHQTHIKLTSKSIPSRSPFHIIIEVAEICHLPVSVYCT
jgi:hypothetical protein